MIDLIILVICTYVFFESVSVASESKGFLDYIDRLIVRSSIDDKDAGFTIVTKLLKQFAKECAPFCQVCRYILNAAASVIIAYYPFQQFKALLLFHYANIATAEPTYYNKYMLLLIALTLMFNVWGRMVNRLVGDGKNINVVATS